MIYHRFMKKLTKLLMLSGMALLLFSCTSYKNVPYLQNSDQVMKSIQQNPELYDARIQPKDLLTIVVSAKDDAGAAPYNLTIPTTLSTSTRSTYSQPVLQAYLVDNEGNVEFPELGTLHLGGLTKGEAEKMIKGKLEQFIINPIVNVRFVNYSISVLGEVSSPGTFTISNEKVNIFEALALAHDMTIYGKRDCVKIIREDQNGVKQIETLNLNDANVINSPYYYLQQNDVVYVEPNKAKAQNSDIGSSTTLWFSAVSILVSLTSLVFNILK